MIKKFELDLSSKITFLGTELFRIKALISFSDVEKGELGGYVEKEENLSHSGNAWVYGDARVYGNARVYGDAEVSKLNVTKLDGSDFERTERKEVTKDEIKAFLRKIIN